MYKLFVWFLREFVKEAGRGGKGNLPLDGTPVIMKTEPWDGKDGEIIEEDEFSLEELMGEDAATNDELWSTWSKKAEEETEISGLKAILMLRAM